MFSLHKINASINAIIAQKNSNILAIKPLTDKEKLIQILKQIITQKRIAQQVYTMQNNSIKNQPTTLHERLIQLKELFDSDLISSEEYEQKRKEVIKSI